MSKIKEREKKLQEELDSFDDWKERYNYILDLGEELEDMPEELKVDVNKVKGCVSQAWLFGVHKGNTIHFYADSDSLFVKGLVAIMLKLYEGLTPDEILTNNSNFLLDSGLVHNLSPNRANGIAAMQLKIKEYADIYKNS